MLLEFHMLAHHGIIFAESHFFRNIARVFPGHIIVTGSSRADEFDFYNCRLRHISGSLIKIPKYVRGKYSYSLSSQVKAVKNTDKSIF